MLNKLTKQFTNQYSNRKLILKQQSFYLKKVIQQNLKMGCQMAVSQQTSEPHKLSFRARKSRLIDSRRKSTMITDHISENVTILRDNLQKQQIKFAFKCLSEHEFFSTLKDEEIKEITKSMVLAEAKEGDYVFRQGDPGNSFFIIYTGKVDVQIDNVHVRTLSQGRSFGELALLFRTQRTASIKCKGKDNIFLVVKPASFRASLKKMKVYEYEKNKRMISNVQIFQTLSNQHKELISHNFKTIHFEKGEVIFKEGDPANSFYIVSSGLVRVQIPDKQPIILKTFESFGENAFRMNSYRQGTAVAVEQTVCCFLKKSDLDKIFGAKFHNIFYYNIKKWALIRSESFKSDPLVINALIGKFEVKKAEQGEILVESLPTGLIISLEGTINGKPEGSLFCEKTFINRNVLTNPIIKNDAGDYGYLSYETIDNTLREVNEKKGSKSYSKKCLATDKENMQMFNLSQFEFLKQLGEGQFGKVYLVKNTGFSGNLYAVKTLLKQPIRKEGMEKCVIQEKRILSKIVFPYIVGFAQAFHDQKHIYFLMEYIKGKEMFDVIRQMPLLSRKIATYFFGCLLLAIQHLHENSIIYRDIKPENSVVDYTGKVFLVDLGTAKILKKQNSYRTFTLIGTPHYMAPQTFEASGYSFQADIWSLGVLLYEFIFSKLPFGQQDNDPYVVMKKIKTQLVHFPQSAFVNKEAKELLDLLLQKNPKVRAIKATFQNIKNSTYFTGMDWNDLLNQNVHPPYIPKDFRKDRDHENTMKLNGKPFGQFLYGKSISNKKWTVELWNEDFNMK